MSPRRPSSTVNTVQVNCGFIFCFLLFFSVGCDESGDVFTLKNEIGNEEDDFTDSSSSEQFQNYNTNSNNYSNVFTDSSNWESSVSEFEDSEGPLMTAEKRENQFKSMRAQHYFMKQALMRGKELIETETEDED